MKIVGSKKEQRFIIGATLSLIVGLAVYASSVSPFGASPRVVVAFFVLVFSVAVALVFSVLRLWRKSSRTEAMQSSIVAGIVPTVILALSSLQQFGLTDIVILTLLVILVVFYLRKRNQI